MFKIFKRGQRGFTLVELMVVMAIIAVLAGIVVPAVTGTKGPAEGAQFKGDANAVQSAASKYNNDTVTAAWPEEAVGTIYSLTSTTTLAVTELAAITAAVGAGNIGNYMAIDWDASANMRKTDGSLQSVSFVPDFIPKTPATDGARDRGVHVYVWLFLEGAATDASSRTVEIYKLDDTTLTYSQVEY